MKNQPSIFSVAPMIDWTDRHCRFFHRQLSQQARLYTEMIVAEAVIRGDRDYLLGHDAAEHPLALQLGGSNPARLAEAARIGAEYGYDEINLNVGCPSNRVQSGSFGACLMREPALVAECVAAMQAVVAVPVTVKCRLGVDDQEPEESLRTFVKTVSAAGCTTFVVHARKAWLSGLSPKQNRNVPPLNYDLVYRLRAENPTLQIILNGGITSLAQSQTHLTHLDGVMVGRSAYETPYLLAGVDQAIFGVKASQISAHQVVENMLPYLAAQTAKGVRAHVITRHMLGLFHGQPGARTWRRHLTIEAVKPGAGVAVLRDALTAMSDAARDNAV